MAQNDRGYIMPEEFSKQEMYMFEIEEKKIPLLRGGRDICILGDAEAVNVFKDAWRLIIQVERDLTESNLVDPLDNIKKGLLCIQNGQADFQIDIEVKSRYSFSYFLFNAYPTIILNPNIVCSEQKDELEIIKDILEKLGNHNQSAWDTLANMLF
jgi:hypothetical protein